MKINLKDYDSGDFIKILRQWSGLTQEEFAELLGKSTRTIQDYEAGVINYKIDILKKIINKMNINIIAEKNHLK